MFSIIIPAYNEEKYIARSLKSVLALKKPSDCEVIVVNNASTDKTTEVVKSVFPEVKLIDEPKKGLTRAYNCGAKEAKGDILVFVDADMVLPPDHLERISKEFKKDPKLAALSGPYIYRDNGRFCELATRFTFLFIAMPAEFIFNRFLNLGSSMASGNSAIKKEAFEKVGGFNENIFYGLESDLTLRIKKIGKVRFKHYLSTESSTRRLKKEGTFRLIFQHIVIDVVWPNVFRKPFPKDYSEVR